MPSGFPNVLILTVVNALAFAITPMMMLVGSLLGTNLAPKESLATLPIALMVVGTALGVVPASKVMQRLGRKNALWIFLAISLVACFIAAHSLVLVSFSLFCVAAMIIGATNAAFQQIRFAAMESVDASRTVTAASIVMLGGVGAAFLGPELAVLGRNLTAVEYQGSFWLIAVCIGLAALVLVLFRSAPRQDDQELSQPPRPLKALVSNPTFCLAVASGAVGYMIMTFVMTATPISMHHHHGHGLLETKWVIQSHIAAMFLPSLILPWVSRLIGVQGTMVAGLCCYVATIGVGLTNTSVMGFWTQLVILGVGWNFLFIAGTSLLPSTYREGEQFKAQSFNDGVVFSIQALASLSAGLVISQADWQTVLLVCLLPIAFMVGVLVWVRWFADKNVQT